MRVPTRAAAPFYRSPRFACTNHPGLIFILAGLFISDTVYRNLLTTNKIIAWVDVGWSVLVYAQLSATLWRRVAPIR